MVRKRDLKGQWRRISLVRLVQNTVIGVVALQALTVIVLWVVAELRGRYKHEVRFPHLRLHEVQVGFSTCPGMWPDEWWASRTPPPPG